MNKIVGSPEQAVADIPDGATVAIAGFGVAHRFATALICALRDQQTKERGATRCGIGSGDSWGGQRPRAACYVATDGGRDAATTRGARSCWLCSWRRTRCSPQPYSFTSTTM